MGVYLNERTIDFVKSRCTVDPESGCWNWKMALSHGYGEVCMEGKMCRVSRIVAGLKYGEDAIIGLVVRHTCDNPKCCNPDHLLIGTDRDNALDSVRRNTRDMYLSMAQATELRNDYLSGHSISMLMSEYDISRSVIMDILYNRSHVDEDWKPIGNRRPPYKRSNIKLRIEDAQFIRRAIKENLMTRKQLSLGLGVAQNTISAIITGTRWRSALV